MADAAENRNPEQTPTGDWYMTTSEVAERARMSPRSVRKWFPASRVGGKWLYRNSDVERILAEGTQHVA